MTSDRRTGGVNILYLSCALAGKNPKPRLTWRCAAGEENIPILDILAREALSFT